MESMLPFQGGDQGFDSPTRYQEFESAEEPKRLPNRPEGDGAPCRTGPASYSSEAVNGDGMHRSAMPAAPGAGLVFTMAGSAGTITNLFDFASAPKCASRDVFSHVRNGAVQRSARCHDRGDQFLRSAVRNWSICTPCSRSCWATFCRTLSTL